MQQQLPSDLRPQLRAGLVEVLVTKAHEQTVRCGFPIAAASTVCLVASLVQRGASCTCKPQPAAVECCYLLQGHERLLWSATVANSAPGGGILQGRGSEAILALLYGGYCRMQPGNSDVRRRNAVAT